MQCETLKCLHLQPKVISRNKGGVALEKNRFMYYISDNPQGTRMWLRSLKAD